MPQKDLPISVDKFRELFINRDDIYSIQDVKGAAYHKVSRPITDQTIKDHMLGKQTIGLYQLKNNTVKWALIDIDINKEIWNRDDFKVENWQEKIKKQSSFIQEKLKSKGMTSYRENSGFKGEHVWVFFDKPLSAILVKNVFDSLFKNTFLVDPDNMHLEIFPKQSHATDTGPGSLIKAPLGRHQRNNKFSKFIDDIKEVKFVTEDVIKKAINEYDAIFQGCSALRELRDEGIHSEHLGNEERLAIAYIFGNLGQNGIDYIEKELFSKLSDYDKEKFRYHIQRITEKYKPITCKTLQEKGFCPGPCAAIGNNKSPIAFYYKQKGIQSDDTEIKAISKIDGLEMHGHCYYDYSKDFKTPELISNFVLNLFEQVHIDDGINEYTLFRGNVINEDGVHDIEIKAEEFASAEKFSAAIYSVLGNSGTFMADPGKVRLASNKFSQKNKITIKKMFGYNENFTKYYTPSTMISADKICSNEELIINLEGEGQAESLDMTVLDDAKFKEVKKHIDDDLLQLADFETTHTAIAHTMLAPIEPFVDIDDRSKYAFFVRGQSGTGKSFLMTAMQNFYGSFPENVVTWASTPYAIQRLGYFFKDCLFLIDDFKKSNISNYPTMLQVLQTYADTTARARLKSSGQSMGASWPIKGFIAITGEDTVEGEASNIARMITIEYSGKHRDIDKGDRVKKMKQYYKGFTPRYIQYILKQDKEEISDTRQKYLREFLSLIDGEANDVRISRNMAILMTSYEYFAKFMWNKNKAESNIIKLKSYLKTLLKTVLSNTKEEKSAIRFWNLLQEYIASGRLRIASSANSFVPDNERGAVVGFIGGNKTWLMKSVAYSEVQKILRQSGDSLHHGEQSIMSDLADEGIIKTAKAVTRKYNGKSVRVLEVEFDNPDLIND